MDDLDTEIERLMDRHGARTILERIAYTARGKSEERWQDAHAARQWSGLMQKINEVSIGLVIASLWGRS